MTVCKQTVVEITSAPKHTHLFTNVHLMSDGPLRGHSSSADTCVDVIDLCVLFVCEGLGSNLVPELFSQSDTSNATRMNLVLLTVCCFLQLVGPTSIDYHEYLSIFIHF